MISRLGVELCVKMSKLVGFRKKCWNLPAKSETLKRFLIPVSLMVNTETNAHDIYVHVYIYIFFSLCLLDMHVSVCLASLCIHRSRACVERDS